MKLYSYMLEECDGKLYFNENEIEVDEQISDNKFVVHYDYEYIPDSEYLTNEIYVTLQNDDWGYHQETSSYIYLKNECEDLKSMKEVLRDKIVDEIRKEMNSAIKHYESAIENYSKCEIE